MGEMERVKPEEISKTKLRREGTGASAWGGGGGGGSSLSPPGVPVCPGSPCARSAHGEGVLCGAPTPFRAEGGCVRYCSVSG